MKEKLLIVEDEFVAANHLKLLLTAENYQILGIARSVNKARQIISQTKPDMVLLDIFLKGEENGIDLARELKKSLIPFIYISANSNADILLAAKETEPEGFIVKPFRKEDILVTLEIAKYRHSEYVAKNNQREEQVRVQLAKLLEPTHDKPHLLFEIVRVLQSIVPYEYLDVSIQHPQKGWDFINAFRRISFDEYQIIDKKSLLKIYLCKEDYLQHALTTRFTELAPCWYNESEFVRLCEVSLWHKLIAKQVDVKSCFTYPLVLNNNAVIYFSFYSVKQDAYTQNARKAIDVFYSLLENLLRDSVKFGDTKISFTHSNIEKATDRSKPNGNVMNGIIGKSPSLLSVLDQLIDVSPTDSSVLILGESGTGKERIAQNIHLLSGRSKFPFIKVNCSTLPATLIESELFGHEKGAFTGALEKRIGKFELGNNGTVFLDEIGELSLEMQSKFLRVLQEREIDRVGSSNVTKVNIRIIAATNRDLEKEVAEGRFRLDLYYRLNVFPVILPPLRDRREDIPLLVAHFIERYNAIVGKNIKGISDSALNNLMSYSWPGNIRELEHIIERHILLSRGDQIESVTLPKTTLVSYGLPKEELVIKSIDDNEKDYIIQILKVCEGKVWGKGAAAEMLKISPSTLKSKMIKLGINKMHFMSKVD